MAGKSKNTDDIADNNEVIDPASVESSLNEFLKNDKAVENLKSLLGMFMKKSQSDQWQQLLYKTLVVGVLVGAVVFLSYHDKFTSAVAFAVGTLSGVVLASNRD